MISPEPLLRTAPTSQEIDQWRARIRADATSNYHYQMAVALERAGNDAAAQDAYRHAVDARPDFPAAIWRLAGVLRRLGSTGQADALIARAEAGIPDFQAVSQWHLGRDDLNLGDVDAARPRFQQALALFKNNPPSAMAQDFLRLGREYQRRGDRGARLEMLDIAARLAGIDGDIVQDHAHALFQMGRVTEAVDVMRGLSARVPQAGKARYQTGVFLAAALDLDEAAAHLRAIGDLAEPYQSGALYHLALIDQAAGRYDAALAGFTDLIARKPRKAVYLAHAGLCRDVAGMPDGMALIDRALALDAENLYAMSFKSLILTRAGEPDAALDLHAMLPESAATAIWPRLAQAAAHQSRGESGNAQLAVRAVLDDRQWLPFDLLLVPWMASLIRPALLAEGAPGA
ncbi:tetratricopeptide repeat protein [Niveispirillum fermenti]|uniref:tetratricopeptide repeat protein n=1 Tax=Niveispirillum fermenti TaxID=1233113 RepID=UPI003A84CB38